MVDWIERAGDRESFLWARQLVRQEGIFAGGSSGSALAGALKYCRKLSGDRLAVVIFPDSGSRYLSKFYDDKWMREFGFLSTEFGETSLRDLLHAKPNKILHVAALGDSMRKVVTTMHQHGISQMPVVGPGGELVGLLEEVDLLNHMLEEHEHNPEEVIDPLIQNAGAVFPADTPLEETLPSRSTWHLSQAGGESIHRAMVDRQRNYNLTRVPNERLQDRSGFDGRGESPKGCLLGSPDPAGD